MAEAQAPARIDKWLWVVRLAKTRGLAAEAVRGGRVAVNGQRVKPSKEVRPGDEVEVTTGETRRTVVVLGVAPRRVGAAEAALLYRETDESRAARERLAEERRLTRAAAESGPRPTKRDRRRFEAQERGRRGGR